MARGTNASVSPARWLVGVITGLVLCFVLETVLTQHRESAIAGRANKIIANAMPSVQLLTNALGDVDRLDLDLDEYAAATPNEQPARRDRVRQGHLDLDARVASYLALPTFPDEPGLAGQMSAALRAVDERIEPMLASGDASSVIDLHRKLDMLEQSLRRLVEFNASQGQQLGLEIEQIRGDTIGLVALLDVASIALAAIAALLAVRQLRRATSVLEVARTSSEQREAALATRAEALAQFAGRVAHDILSPLSAVLMSLELARPICEADLAARRATTRGIAAVHRVHTLVDGLLTFSRAGGEPAPGVSTELGPVFADTLGELSLQATQQHIALEAAPVPNGAVACSPGVLTSLISNLVTNAIRYMGDPPRRRIDVRVIDAGARWRVEVQDTGPGVPLDQQQRIFEPHVQLGRGAGIGLGLATVDRLVRAHGGSLGVISPSTGGSLFWFELPKAIAGVELPGAPVAG